MSIGLGLHHWDHLEISWALQYESCTLEAYMLKSYINKSGPTVHYLAHVYVVFKWACCKAQSSSITWHMYICV